MDRLQEFLEEDLGSGDITTELIVPDRIGKAIIRCEAAAILAGIEEAATIFEDGDLDVEILSEDGDEVGAGQAVMEVEGPLADILTRERTALNMLMRMSGIATMTDAAIEACQKANPDVRIAATRKTTPGFRFFEKKAVILGGGDPHRYGLYDHILIKDNHILACGGVRKAMELVQDAPFTYKVEIEVESQKDAVTAAQMGADIILCDPHRAVVNGPALLYGATVTSPDVRAGMALVIAAACAHGESIIQNIYQIERGYEALSSKLEGLGIAITRR